MSHVLNELISMGRTRSVEEEARVAEKIVEDSIRIRDALSRIETSKQKWDSEYCFNEESKARKSKWSLYESM